jgi:glutaminyl-tRNA synthetase
VVHLPDVRFHARPVGFDRAHHALHLHAGVRGPPAAVRLVHRELGIYHPQQIEFDRLNLTYTLLSKRKLLTLVQNGHVRGWDDPRMPTISGIRRRGYTPEAIRELLPRIGVSKTNGMTSWAAGALRARGPEQARAARDGGAAAAALVIDNYPEDQVEEMEAVNNPEDAARARAKVPFSRCSTSSRTTSARTRPSSTYRLCRRDARCGCATATSSRARAW